MPSSSRASGRSRPVGRSEDPAQVVQGPIPVAPSMVKQCPVVPGPGRIGPEDHGRLVMLQRPPVLAGASVVITQVELGPVVVLLEERRPLEPGEGLPHSALPGRRGSPTGSIREPKIRPRGDGLPAGDGVPVERRREPIAECLPGTERPGEGHRRIADADALAASRGVAVPVPVERDHPEEEQLVDLADQPAPAGPRRAAPVSGRRIQSRSSGIENLASAASTDLQASPGSPLKPRSEKRRRSPSSNRSSTLSLISFVSRARRIFSPITPCKPTQPRTPLGEPGRQGEVAQGEVELAFQGRIVALLDPVRHLRLAGGSPRAGRRPGSTRRSRAPGPAARPAPGGGDSSAASGGCGWRSARGRSGAAHRRPPPGGRPPAPTPMRSGRPDAAPGSGGPRPPGPRARRAGVARSRGGPARRASAARKQRLGHRPGRATAGRTSSSPSPGNRRGPPRVRRGRSGHRRSPESPRRAPPGAREPCRRGSRRTAPGPAVGSSIRGSWARLKSSSIGRPSPVTRTFDGLTSRCRTPRSWACWSASAIRAPHQAIACA